MKRIISIVLLCLAISFSGIGQIIKDVTTWTTSVKKLNDKEYDLITTCTLKPHWHIWSINPGGDGLLIPPSITFEKNKIIN